jgi:phenylalanyl-tRNA synthetase beta subunit
MKLSTPIGGLIYCRGIPGGVTIMTETITQLAKKFVSENENWYVDTNDSYIEVAMENKQNFGGFLTALNERDAEYHISQTGYDDWFVVEVLR